MSDIQPPLRGRSDEERIAQIRCPKCQKLMARAPMVPGLGHLADRIFECVKCEHIQITPHI
jgi:phage FluMu protein Com